MIHDVKSSLCQKDWLVCGGHVLQMDLNTYASTVESLSVSCIHLIAEANDMELLCRDVGNAFIHAYTKEKAFTQAGPEFGPKYQGKLLIIVKALYGMKTSAEHWRAHFAETLSSLGFTSSHFDQDVWLRMHKDGSGYDYIVTHMDDFMITAKDPHAFMQSIQKTYMVKDIGKPSYYLGNDYFIGKDGYTYIGSSTYVCEMIYRVEAKFGVLSKDVS